MHVTLDVANGPLSIADTPLAFCLQAYSKRSEFAEAKADLSKALELDPENKEVAAELKRCNAAAKKAAEQEKAMYSKMAGMFGK